MKKLIILLFDNKVKRLVIQMFETPTQRDKVKRELVYGHESKLTVVIILYGCELIMGWWMWQRLVVMSGCFSGFVRKVTVLR